MREIHFRGKTEDGKWVEGGFHQHTKVLHCAFSVPADSPNDTVYLIIRDGMADWELPVPIEGVEVLPETVGQYTGLTDIDGKKIFEGDIVDILDCFFGGVAVVEYKDGCWVGREEKYLTKALSTVNPAGRPKLKLLGNRWDNPELMEAIQK